MSARVTWEGLDELRAALRSLPDDLAGEASGLVLEHANAAEAEIMAAYPQGPTGHLKSGMDVIKASAGRYGAGAVVRNRAPHAYMFENGTQARHTAIGANRGSMPAGHVFIPRIIKYRRRMYEALKGMVTRQGLQVSGDA